MNARSGADFTNIDAWLSDYLGVDPARLEHAGIGASKRPSRSVRGLLARALVVYGELLRAQHVPVFEHGRIVMVQALDKAVGNCRATVALPVLDNLRPGVFRELFRLAVNLVLGHLSRRPSREAADALFHDLENAVFAKLTFKKTFKPVTVTICDLLFKRGVPFRHMGEGVIRIGQGCRLQDMQSCTIASDSSVGARIARDKRKTARLLRTAGMPAPMHRHAASHEEARAAAGEFGWPVVVKPADLERSVGVTVEIETEAALIEAFDRARALSENILIERQIPGICHRILVANSQVIYAVKRRPKSVLGNGRDTVATLIANSNERLSRMPPWKRLIPFPADEIAQQCLVAQGLTLDAVPDEKQWVKLRPFVSEDWGGVVEDLSADIHPDNVRLAIDATRALDLTIAGVDLMTVDISRPWHENGAVIIEMNYNPQFDIRGRQAEGNSFVSALVDEDGRIPVHLVVGEGDLIGHARKLRDALNAQGKACHLTTATHTEDHEGRELKLLLSTLFDRGLALAMRPEVRELILVASPNEILERGIAVDRLESAHVVDSDTKRARALTAILSNRFFIKAVQTATGGAAFSRLGQAPVEDAPVRQDGVI
ncbi:MAG TPA: hypothetical protein VJM34_11300 [Novosphingobium sp.]|nr:hypothetical protein [Novosphingobium sp.]